MHSMHLMHIYEIFYSLSTRIYDELTQYFKLVLDYSTRQGTRLENYRPVDLELLSEGE